MFRFCGGKVPGRKTLLITAVLMEWGVRDIEFSYNLNEMQFQCIPILPDLKTSCDKPCWPLTEKISI